MSLLVNLLIICGMTFAAILGAKRGMVLIALQLNGYILATLVALAVYQPLGGAVNNLLHLNRAVGNVIAFIVTWIMVELTFAIIIRFKVMPYIEPRVTVSLPNRVGGGLLGAVTAGLLATLILLVVQALPVSSATKNPILQSGMSLQLLSASEYLQLVPTTGLGRDFSDALAFFTVPAEPQSEELIELGYTTTNVSIDLRSETAMLELLNRERVMRGLTPLKLNIKARNVARAHSADEFARGYFSHIDPDGHDPFYRMTAGGVEYHSAGENLALAPTLAEAHDGLMKSPGHRANILSADYHAVGIGIIDGGPNGLMITQNFTD